jgi:diadenosine tetraphosphate (Ap4A) HIT family hydrolase
MKINDCVFCHVDPALLIAESKSFFVIRDPFPLMEGHIMIVSKTHYGCVGELPPEQMHELNDLKDHFSTKIHDSFGEVSFYEHGRAGTCQASEGANAMPTCHHMHLHAIPLDSPIQKILEGQYLQISQKSFLDIPENFYRFGNYIFFENGRFGSYFFAADDSYVAPHLMRTLIAEIQGKPELAKWENYKRKGTAS